MTHIHLILQAKGGVGKSLVAALIAQWYQEKKISTLNIDADPINATFSGYKALNVLNMSLLDDNNHFNEPCFTDLIDKALAKVQDLIIDSDIFLFRPLLNYMSENIACKPILNTGNQVFIHIIITGGQSLIETLRGLKLICQSIFQDSSEHRTQGLKIIVWLNDYFGEIISGDKSFEEMRVYLDNKHHIFGIIRLFRQAKETFARDFNLMLSEKLTFQDAMESQMFDLMAKQRLSMIRRSIFQQLDMVL